MNILQDRFACRLITFAGGAGSLRLQKLLASRSRYCKSYEGDTASVAILQLLRLLEEL